MSDRLTMPSNVFPAATESEWRSRVDAVLKGADFAKKLVGRTADGLAIQPLYPRKADAALICGAQAGKPWHVMARVDHPDAGEAASLALQDLEGGADALTLVFPDAPSARGFGLPCDTVAELDAALAGVQIELIKLRLDPAPAGRINALMVAALVERRKLAPAQMDIDFGMNPVGTLMHRGQAPWDWQSISARLAETVSSLLARGFKGPFLTIDLRHHHNAGASEGQELAAGLAQAVLYLRALEAHGVPLDQATQALSFIVPLDADQFMGIAKLRALRKLWNRVQTACGLTPQPVTIHAETSWRMLTKRDPHVNILRNTIATFAAGIGGADSVTVLPFTAALGLPDADARRLARNTSVVLQEESSLWRVTDPSAGAGGYEALTDELAAKAWALFQEIEREGGLVQSLVSGALQTRIAATAKARAKDIATRKQPITGTSEFANIAEIVPEVLNVGLPQSRVPKARSKAASHIGSVETIEALIKGAGRADMAPPMTGHLEITPLPSHRDAEPFEALRDRADAMLAKTGKRTVVTLVTLGALSDHSARLGFMQNLFAAGGIEIALLPSPNLRSGLPDLKTLPDQHGQAHVGMGEGREGAGSSSSHSKDPLPTLPHKGGGPGLICLVGSDAAYGEQGVATAKALSARGHKLWLAGKPGELEAELGKAGVTRFVFMGCDVVEILKEALNVTHS